MAIWGNGILPHSLYRSHDILRRVSQHEISCCSNKCRTDSCNTIDIHNKVNFACPTGTIINALGRVAETSKLEMLPFFPCSKRLNWKFKTILCSPCLHLGNDDKITNASANYLILLLRSLLQARCLS